jgi:tRNA nucleotidyltransferase (CCA-adding enzyme)
MQIFRVGGAVRDKLLNYPCQENDWVVVGSSPEEMISLGFTPIGRDFPVFIKPETGEEYALARTERNTGRGYAGFTFFTNPEIGLEEDLKRRDLTINAMAEDNDGNILDPFNGQKDIESRIFRHVSGAFNEDPVRVLRIARFAARYAHMGFTIASETKDLIIKMVRDGELQFLVAERIWKEMSRALSEQSPHIFIKTLDEFGALKDTLPELDQYFNAVTNTAPLLENNRKVRTLNLLQETARLTNKISIRFSSLLHNLDEIRAPEFSLNGCTQPISGQYDSVEALCNRLKVPKNVKKLAITVAEFRSQSHNCFELEPLALLRFLKSVGALNSLEQFNDFLTACSADFNCHNDTEDRNYPSNAYLAGARETLLGVNVKDLVTSGRTGADIGVTLEKRRVIALTHFKDNFKAR